MNEKLAREICGAMASVVVAGHIGEKPDMEKLNFLRGLPLLQLVQAQEVFKALPVPEPVNGVTTVGLSCDDRVTAALYVFLHYRASREPILQFGNQCVAKCVLEEEEVGG